jgi:hypothetical protein
LRTIISKNPRAARGLRKFRADVVFHGDGETFQRLFIAAVFYFLGASQSVIALDG